LELLRGHENAHGGLPGAEELSRVGIDCEPDHVGESIGRQLVVGAGVVTHSVSGSLGTLVDEPRTTTARRQHRRDRGDQQRTVFLIKEERARDHTVFTLTYPHVASIAPLLLTASDTLRVDAVASVGGGPIQLLRGEARRALD